MTEQLQNTTDQQKQENEQLESDIVKKSADIQKLQNRFDRSSGINQKIVEKQCSIDRQAYLRNQTDIEVIPLCFIYCSNVISSTTPIIVALHLAAGIEINC